MPTSSGALALPLSGTQDRDRSDEFVSVAQRIAEAGKKEGIPIRVLGACAIRIHSHSSKRILDQVGRHISDLDFITHGRHEPRIKPLFMSLGYRPDSEVSKYYAHMYGLLRDRFKDPNTDATLDVFYDKLEMCHTIDLARRLDFDFPTIPVSDLLLEKMQIVKINKKDIEDTLVLFREHQVSEDGKDFLDSKYIAGILSEDWGFYYTVTTNLQKLKEFANSYPILNDSSETIRNRVDSLLGAVEAHPKSLKWKIRARVGTRQKWYNDVDEVSMGPNANGG